MSLAAGPSPIGVDHGQQDVLGLTQRDHPALAVVPARIRALNSRMVEDLGRKLKIETAFLKVPIALACIPDEAQWPSIRLYIQMPQAALSG